MRNILFYKFVKLSGLEAMREALLSKALELGLLGKLLIAEEGVNGCVSGEDDKIDEFKEFITSSNFFGAIEFKEGRTDRHTFKKMFVRIRPEIITFRQKIDLSNTAGYIEPQELKEALDRGDEIIMLDARNDYESEIGRFKGAVTPKISLFSQLPEQLEQMPELKKKTIVTYCTGGIRCEKSAAWMKQKGFENVRQLHGGIIRYGAECGNSHWEGKCFVFDRRGAIDIDPKNQSAPITQCQQCAIPCSDYHNCANVDCDKRIILCKKCMDILNYCCSKNCREHVKRHPAKFAPESLEDLPVQLC